jgi:hypothetical protein
MLQPTDSPLLVECATLITPKLVDFGALLFAERIGWSIKEMWVNVLNTGGRQVHNHANSYASGVVYLTTTHPDAQTVFMKSPGGSDFAFRNDHSQTKPGPYSSDKWISPASPPTSCCFPATSCTRCHPIPASSYALFPSPSRAAVEGFGYAMDNRSMRAASRHSSSSTSTFGNQVPCFSHDLLVRDRWTGVCQRLLDLCAQPRVISRVIHSQSCRQSTLLCDACQQNSNCVRDGQSDVRQSGGCLRFEVIIHGALKSVPPSP